MILTRLFTRGQDETVVRRAPKNKVFFVEAVMFHIQDLNVVNTIYLLGRHMKTGTGGRPIIGAVGTNNTPDLMAAYNTARPTNDAADFWVGQINHKTKYLSLAYENTNAFDGVVIVYGEIVSETKSNLIWEFITKRHR